MKPIILRMVLIFSFIFFARANSQVINLTPVPHSKTEISLSYDRILTSSEPTYSSFSGVYNVGVNVPVSPTLNFTASLPVLNFGEEYNYSFRSFKREGSGIGNLFLGVQTKTDSGNGSSSIVTAGLFLPTAMEEMLWEGLYSNFYGLQSYIPNTAGIFVNYGYHRIFDGGFNYALEVGPNLLIPTEGSHRDIELLGHYGVNIGQKFGNILVNAELLGMVFITQDFGSTSDSFYHLVNFGIQYQFDFLTLKIYYRKYLKEDMNRNADGVFGLGLTFALN